MKRTTRYLTGLLTASTLLVSLGAGTAQAEQIPAPAVPPAKMVAAGMRITFDDHTEYGNNCTLGAVGTDSAGRKVGITAGHCNPTPYVQGPGDEYPSNPDNDHRQLPDNTWKPYLGPVPTTHTTENTHRVWDARDVASGPIGWIRWVSNDAKCI